MVRSPAARPAALLLGARLLRAPSLLLSASLLLGACSTPRPSDGPAPGPQGAAEVARRHGGARAPAEPDARALGLSEVEPGVWVPEADAPHWGMGGRGLEAPPGAPSGQGLLLRSRHVQLETDLPGHEALALLRVAQGHVQACMARWGEALDLRLPRAPLAVEVHARRAGLEAALAQRAAPAAAQAWYDRERARVLLACEPAPQGSLPVAADLRHELVHALLEQAAPDAPPWPALARGEWLWLWEGVALAAEDGIGAGEGPAWHLRRARLAERLRRDGLLPLGTLCALPAAAWEGRHYDLCAAWLASLAQDPAWRAREAGLLRALLRGDLGAFDGGRAFGRTLAAEQARFTAWLAAEGVR
ncbi:MAG: hypothetical protein ACKOSS_01600 [Planctomycetia bacterium]